MENDIRLPNEIIPLSNFFPSLDRKNVFKSAQQKSKPVQAWSDVYFNIQLCSSHSGGVYIEVGETKLAVSIPPPRGTNPTSGVDEKAEVNVSVKYEEFACKRRENLETLEFFIVREVKHSLENTICLSEYTNMAFEVKIIVFEDDGCALATAINGCSLALLLGGVHTFDIISASTTCLYKGSYYNNPNGNFEEFINDAIQEDSKCKYGWMTCTTYGCHKQVAQMYCYGLLNEEHMAAMIEQCTRMNDYLTKWKIEVVKDFLKYHLKVEKRNVVTVKLAHKYARKLAFRRIRDELDAMSL